MRLLTSHAQLYAAIILVVTITTSMMITGLTLLLLYIYVNYDKFIRSEVAQICPVWSPGHVGTATIVLLLQYHALNHLSGTSKTVVWTQNFWTINSNSGPFGVCLLSFHLHTVPKLPHEALKEAGFHGNFSPSRGVKFLNGWFQGRQNFGKNLDV